MKAALALESGCVFRGRAFGAPGEACGEVVFNTAITGYQEILTDPSYRGQIVCMTYPMIGNTGVNREDVESRKIFLSGFIVKELSGIVSNWRSCQSLDDYLKEQEIPGIEGIDTRALALHLREKGSEKGILSTKDLDPQSLVRKARDSKGIVGADLVKEVLREPFDWSEQGKYKVVALDSGIKWNILRELAERRCRVVVLPATASREEILSLKPDGLVLSNGPGDPEVLDYMIRTARGLIGELPIFGICLGHQILGLALGGKTTKLKFGHHGANHPVIDLDSGRVHITSQNHGFAVLPESIPGGAVRVTHINLNDKTCEGMEHRELPIFSVQYHPEASPGPHDSKHLFDRFLEFMQRCRKVNNA